MMDKQRDWQNELEAAKKELLGVIAKHQPIIPDDLPDYLSTEIGVMAIAYYQLYRAGQIIETAEGLCLASQDNRGGA